jgi:hypothetical protein
MAKHKPETLKLIDPTRLDLQELQELFIQVSKHFVDCLADCDDVAELEHLQHYMRSITEEIKKRQKQ